MLSFIGSSATIDIPPFADSAFTAIRSVDPLILQILSPQVDKIEISRDQGDPDLAGKWLRLRRVGIRFLFWGIALIVLTYVARNVTFGGDCSSPLSEALVLFAASRLQMWSIILTAIGFVVTTLGAIINRRVTSA